jgi:hypothetical protein
VITSRNQLTGLVAAEGAHPLTLDLLTAEEARDLLVERLGARRCAADPEAVEEIIVACAQLPLALVIVAARAAARPDFPLAAFAAQLRESRGLDAFDGDEVVNVRSVFDWSYRTLADDPARLFRLLGVHPTADLGVAAAASLAGVPAAAVRPLLADLARAHLISEYIPGRYSMHDLLRAYAAELAERTKARRSETQRYIGLLIITFTLPSPRNCS